MKRPWGVHTVGDVVGSPDCAAGLPDGRWVRAVPMPYSGNRIVAAWWVLTGRAFALVWPTSKELADALNPYEPRTKFPSRKRSDLVNCFLQAERSEGGSPSPAPTTQEGR